ncbi:uroporphyrinogen-III synthase [Xanthomonas oryzae]|uniref:Uroporphyrinogen-III synthase n=9 Tax=Xanthomonas oryzae TaxID=347 RepID=A0A0K0GGZ2_XANOP|nr:uroporphyrinogen-III synthase [Xanthomonas oryzae]ACD57415.1 uroporphyrinogen-III synthase [Xanthomonas oryzae pv. oryzae PXO99A]AWK19917.1 uroporphyrinogen-III synthase [Xanthomonas oryzae pv. oryzae]AXI19054.1 uroporphyrinogen-III synthase [Xanthomonas oryzae pv. oryzae]AXI23042.1 uroporphyrinogen-III synthase [Xanthomonas oryzae pv. oryzae]AXM11185.1 uroporphyrinogen-III synthase [Xanthomonas oryzae pv. oryzae]
MAALSHNHTMTGLAHPDAAWTLISLRPSGEHAPLRRAVARHGGRVLALSPWRLQTNDAAQARDALRQALAAPIAVFTSPAAVQAAHRLAPLQRPAQAHWVSVGDGTARALQACGIDTVVRPTRMDSEGLLALPLLQAPLQAVGLITAPGGRGMLAPTLEQRGARIVRADVYQRIPLRLRASAIQALSHALPRSVLALSSAEALTLVLQQLPSALIEKWQRRPVVASSDRMLDAAHAAGFIHRMRAEGPLPKQLAAAAAAIVTPPRPC